MEKDLAPLHNQKIMLVDDDEDFSEVMSWVLGQAGYETMSFKDPALALLALQNQTDLALIVVDYHMEAMNGDEFLKLKHPMSTCPVMMVSGSPEDVTDKVPAHLFQEIMAKPLDLENLMEKVRRFLH